MQPAALTVDSDRKCLDFDKWKKLPYMSPSVQCSIPFANTSLWLRSRDSKPESPNSSQMSTRLTALSAISPGPRPVSAEKRAKTSRLVKPDATNSSLLQLGLKNQLRSWWQRNGERLSVSDAHLYWSITRCFVNIYLAEFGAPTARVHSNSCPPLGPCVSHL